MCVAGMEEPRSESSAEEWEGEEKRGPTGPRRKHATFFDMKMDSGGKKILPR